MGQNWRRGSPDKGTSSAATGQPGVEEVIRAKKIYAAVVCVRSELEDEDSR